MSRPAPRPGPLGALLRVALLAVSLALLWRAERRLEYWRVKTASELTFKAGAWFGWLVPAALSGAAFGLALWLPGGRAGFRWGRPLLLGVPCLVLLLHYYLVFGVVAPHRLEAFRFLDLPTPFWEPGPQFALAAFLGITAVSGFAEDGG